MDHVSKFQLFKVQLQETIPVSSSIFRQPRIFHALPPWKNDQVRWGLLFFFLDLFRINGILVGILLNM